MDWKNTNMFVKTGDKVKTTIEGTEYDVEVLCLHFGKEIGKPIGVTVQIDRGFGKESYYKNIADLKHE